MRRMILAAALAVLPWITPASAQYRFDHRIDPQVCHWTWTCDYGGRAYVARWHHRRRWGHGHHHVHVVHRRIRHVVAHRYIYDPSYPHW